MHQRFLPWLLLGVFLATISLRAQAPANSNPPPGKILVAKLGSGKPWKTVNGVRTDLAVEMEVEQNAIVNTGADGSVILAFSNGATTKLGADTELVIDQFLQDPFNDTIVVAKLDKEPSRSKTKLTLNRGELVGDVKELLHDKGSEFIVNTPVGAAGIRGTVFRIVFRPAANGQAFFQLTTSSGRVDYTQPGQGGTTPGATTVTAAGTAAVAVPQGQEIEITVNVTTNAQGQMVVTALPPAPNTANSAPPAVLAQVTTAAVEIAGAVQNAVFTSQSTAGAGTTTTGGGSTTGSISGQNQGQNQSQNQGQPQNQQNQNQGGQSQNQGQNQGQGTTTTTQQFQTQNTSGQVTVTKQQPQQSIPTGQLTSRP